MGSSSSDMVTCDRCASVLISLLSLVSSITILVHIVWALGTASTPGPIHVPTSLQPQSGHLVTKKTWRLGSAFSHWLVMLDTCTAWVFVPPSSQLVH